ncbi:carbohydrate ABC transporter permease [Vampirovibrio chlorellavorus]|uniref:carbohydrate ABC transporter permease n=1 Tax=Vampirovibrio chlorellavorus TaxID=758823 RepID=UPI0026EBC1BB|nr:sugar ABC transporter permease [Vampirovibrio chlorellavorus]
MFRKQTPYLYLILPAIFMVSFFFLPLIMAFGISLSDYSRDIYHPSFVGLLNYARLAHSAPFWNALRNTFVFLLGVVPAMVLLPIFLALLLNGKLKGIAIFRSLIYIPVVISMVVVGIAWRWLYADDGLLNWFLSLFHLPKVGWLVSPDIALYSVMIVVVWKGLAYYMMMYLAHLQSLSSDLYEAAEIDGANLWQKHWHVTLPHLQPTMVMVGIISTIGSLKVFTEIYVMTRGGPVGATKTLVYYIYERAFENLDLGIASAAGIVLMLILLAFSLLEMKLSPKDDNTPKPIKPASAKKPPSGLTTGQLTVGDTAG